MLNLHLICIAALIVVSLLQQVSDVYKMNTESMLWWKYCEMLMHHFLYPFWGLQFYINCSNCHFIALSFLHALHYLNPNAYSIGSTFLFSHISTQ